MSNQRLLELSGRLDNLYDFLKEEKEAIFPKVTNKYIEDLQITIKHTEDEITRIVRRGWLTQPQQFEIIEGVNVQLPGL